MEKPHVIQLGVELFQKYEFETSKMLQDGITAVYVCTIRGTEVICNGSSSIFSDLMFAYALLDNAHKKTSEATFMFLKDILRETIMVYNSKIKGE